MKKLLIFTMIGIIIFIICNYIFNIYILNKNNNCKNCFRIFDRGSECSELFGVGEDSHYVILSDGTKKDSVKYIDNKSKIYNVFSNKIKTAYFDQDYSSKMYKRLYTTRYLSDDKTGIYCGVETICEKHNDYFEELINSYDYDENQLKVFNKMMSLMGTIEEDFYYELEDHFIVSNGHYFINFGKTGNVYEYELENNKLKLVIPKLEYCDLEYFEYIE